MTLTCDRNLIQSQNKQSSVKHEQDRGKGKILTRIFLEVCFTSDLEPIQTTVQLLPTNYCYVKKDLDLRMPRDREMSSAQDRLTVGQTYYYRKTAKRGPYSCNCITWYTNSYMVGFCIRLESSHLQMK